MEEEKGRVGEREKGKRDEESLMTGKKEGERKK